MPITISEEENAYGTLELTNTSNNKTVPLPHGSGIDATWEVEQSNNTITCKNSYHCMNYNGFYDGWIDFSLKIPTDQPLSFRLQFHTNSTGWYRIYKYQLQQYLEDLFAYTLTELED